ncbi:MAG TPA: hypothetical protein VG500_13440 [Gemmatimonadales bacterium]|jgi:hypothetical protein|nr:hypothetical protein [Gemmatimonadales bacterium]
MSFHSMTYQVSFGWTLTFAGLAGLGAAPLLAGVTDRRAPEVVRAQRLELVDAQGRTQAIVRSDSLGFAVVLLDRQGAPTGILRLNEQPRLAIETGRGREVAGLGAPTVQHLTE